MTTRENTSVESLIHLAQCRLDAVTVRDMEQAEQLADSFNTAFAAFQAETAAHPLNADRADQIVELRDLLNAIDAQTQAWITQTGRELASVREAQMMTGYSPVPQSERAPRYFDGAA